MTKTKLGALIGSTVLAVTGFAAVVGTASAAPTETRTTESRAAKLSHADAARRLSAAGISLSSSGNCSNRNNPRCTSLEQVNLTTVQGAITLKKASGCDLRITGGTETGHAGGTFSHGNGFKLDFNPNSCLTNYITGTFTFIGRRGDGAAMYRSGSGNIYARESNHWDVTFHSCGGC